MKNDRGFTFIETLLVLAITLILSTSIGLSGIKYIERAKNVTAKNQIAIYSNALHSYYLDCGIFPTENQGINALWRKPDLHPVPQNWNGPYLAREPSLDPWGIEYNYTLSNEAGLPFSIISFGKDGQLIGEIDDNIYSWK